MRRERPFVKQKVLELGMVVGIGLVFPASIATTAFSRLAWQFLPTQIRQLDGGVAWSMSRLPLILSFSMFALIHRFVPNDKVAWGDVWPGALLAAVLVVIIFLLWAYISAFILLLEAEFASEYFRLFGSQQAGLT